ncbi:G-type lectin S-receptor-like serine/threonine-protein kinase At2g19130 isoform X3 [Silene latifolia]|uniref:G-type lectin S-receptor-like serine/threonine-protein kinase At2g19130 isoform X3 n=1 Tax=Silene latifolia TaxID=37657 RepID=UPI003D76F741
MDGINGTVFAYGVTSSGKTHTMHGDDSYPGIIPLAIKDVFSIIQETSGREFLLRVSYLEIYNEVINDLLDPTGQNLRIREDVQGTYVEGIKEEVVLSPGHALSFIAAGEEHRHVGSNNFNLFSSRSHTIFTLMIESSAPGDDYDGVIFSQLPGQQCDVYSYCGAFGYCNQTSLPYCHCLQGFDPKFTNDWNLNDYSGGCSRKTRLSCQFHGNDSSGDKFLMSPSKVLPEHPQFAPTPSLQECESTCLRNCSCTAYAYDTDGCSVWFGELLNMKQLADTDPTGKTLYIRIAATEIPTTTGNKILVLGIVMGLVIGLVLLLVLGFVTNWRQKRRLVIAAKTMETSLTRFGYRDLQLSTKNFLQKLGEGGFGSVFKGTLPDLTDIAVKKLECISFTHGEKQFRTEVSAIGNIQHVNLVRLRGFCSEGTKRLLVYEYMPNGSLNTHLFKKENSQILSWKLRYQIAIGIARGLAYLHEKCRDCIIHCDIKPENILLDSEFCAKVADFGLAKLVGREFSRVLTTIRGTRGYLAPEWISGLAITAKADVYSYGMLLFELVSGRRNASSAKFEFFPTWAMTKLAEGEDILTLLDPILEGDGEKDQVSRVCKLACWCIQDEEDHRPSMGHIVQVLEGFLDVDMPPIPRSLQVFVGNEESIMFFSELSSDQPLTEQTSYASATSSLAPGSRFIEGSISHRGFCRTFSRHCCNIHSLVGSKCFHP